MKPKLYLTLILLFFLPTLGLACPRNGHHTLHIFSTNDIHGHYFDSLYTGGRTQGSLMAVSAFMNEQRSRYGKDNVLLIDAGDFLQGDNAAYYYNYISPLRPHPYVRIAEDMSYDAIIVGNHDIETGPAVYDRINSELRIPFLAANAVDPKTGKSHFRQYVLLRRAGLRILVVGFTNPSMRDWLSEDKLAGMDFIDPMKDDFAQKLVDRARRETSPDVVILAIHSGTGKGDGSEPQNRGLDLLNSLRGVDVVICSHDHVPYVAERDGCCLVNSGSHCNAVAEVTLDVYIDGKSVRKESSARICKMDKSVVDRALAQKYRSCYEEVKEFSNKEIGMLQMPLDAKECYVGMGDYLNLINTVCLKATGARVCFNAPLKYGAFVEKGKVVYDDLFSIYPFENQIYVVEMTGRGIKDYLEASYDGWINTIVVGKGPDGRILTSGEHLLKMQQTKDSRTGQIRWNLGRWSSNLDSAAGINYSVCVTMPRGSRITIHSFADGSQFDENETYTVAITSYRASGGGGLLKAAGVENPKVVWRGDDIRDLIYKFISENKTITPALVREQRLIGKWSFVPEPLCERMLSEDLRLLFPR